MAKVLINNGKSNDDIARNHFGSEKAEKRRKQRQGKRNPDPEKCLIVAVKYPNNNSFISLFSNNELHHFRKRTGTINALCYHDGRLYDAGDYGKIKDPKVTSEDFSGGVYDTLTDEILSYGVKPIRALCSHKGKLYSAGENNLIVEIIKDEKIMKAERSAPILTLCSHKGELYDGGLYKEIYSTFQNKSVAERHHRVLALCSHKGKLYDAGDDDYVFETLDIGDKKVSTKKEKGVQALCSWDDVLFNAGYDEGVYSTWTGNMMVDAGAPITAMCTIPEKLAEELMKK